MSAEDIKISFGITKERIVYIRAFHDVENGSAISTDGASLAEALINLGERLKKGRGRVLSDRVWDKEIITGKNDSTTVKD